MSLNSSQDVETGECRSFLEALATGRQWGFVPSDPTLATHVSAHGLERLIAEALDAGKLNISDAEAQRIKDICRARRSKTAVIDLETERIGHAASRLEEGANLATSILLKGQSVASRYGNPKLRTYSDIDLLVPREEAWAWGRFLRRLGYLPENAWHEQHHGTYDKHIPYRRVISGDTILCEVHTRLCSLRPLADFGYRPLIEVAERAPIPGLMRLSAPGQLIALAIHLLHHFRSHRRLIWYRDFLELGSPQNVQEARKLADTWQVSWALEWALCEVQKAAQQNLWNAQVQSLEDKGLWKVLSQDMVGFPLYVAIAKELPFAKRFRFLASKFDPRRFKNNSGRFEWRLFANWVRRMFRLWHHSLAVNETKIRGKSDKRDPKLRDSSLD